MNCAVKFEALAHIKYRKIPKISCGLIFFKALFEGLIFRRGLTMEGNLRFKIDWASLIVGRKFTVFALSYFVFEGNFQVQAPRPPSRGGGGGCLYSEGQFNRGFFALQVWGAYTWKGLFLEFYGVQELLVEDMFDKFAVHSYPRIVLIKHTTSDSPMCLLSMLKYSILFI